MKTKVLNLDNRPPVTSNFPTRSSAWNRARI